MADALSPEQVRKVARLARLALTDEQVEESRRRLSAVLGYMERLRGLDLTGVEPLAHVLAATAPPSEADNRLDPDEPGPMLAPGSLMRMAPETLPPYIKVPKVLDEGAGA